LNEKIRDLLVICGMPNEQIMEILEDRKQSFYINNFAELIVKECIEVINDNVEVALSATGNVVFEDELLKKHFGIEIEN
jgi:tRNA A22 N-methylase